MSRTNLRRAFRSDRMRALYQRATDAGWTAKRNGADHVLIESPDGTARVSLSATTNSARSALNSEAVFKRWLREQETPMAEPTKEIAQAINRVEARDLYKDLTGEEPPRALPPEEQQSEELVASGMDATEAKEIVTHGCACGCGTEVEKPGSFARGHHMRGYGGFHQPKAKPTPSARKLVGSQASGTVRSVEDPDYFTVEEVVEIATYASTGGLIEVEKLEQGMRLIQKMRGR